MKYARIAAGVVVEIITLPKGIAIEDAFTKDFALTCVPCGAQWLLPASDAQHPPLYYGDGCDARLRPEVLNAIISEIAATVDQAGLAYDATAGENMELAIRYLIQRGQTKGAIDAGGPNNYSATFDPPLTAYNDYLFINVVPTVTNPRPSADQCRWARFGPRVAQSFLFLKRLSSAAFFSLISPTLAFRARNTLCRRTRPSTVTVKLFLALRRGRPRQAALSNNSRGSDTGPTHCNGNDSWPGLS